MLVVAVRLVIGGPTLASVPSTFAEDLAKLAMFTKEHGPWTSVDIDFQPATYVHVGREAFLQRSIAMRRATHVLWLDTDMEFPADTAIRLVSHEKPIVAANCLMRDPRRIWTARRGGERIETTADSTGLEQVDSVGLAVMLLRTEIVATLPRPWFKHGWNHATNSDIGEDLMFCQALRNAGHTIYIDHDLSKEVGHIGQYTYRPTGDAALAV